MVFEEKYNYGDFLSGDFFIDNLVHNLDKAICYYMKTYYERDFQSNEFDMLLNLHKAVRNYYIYYISRKRNLPFKPLKINYDVREF